jgi:A/G-specific adenine glycosylase
LKIQSFSYTTLQFSIVNKEIFSEKLLQWYPQFRRDLPWRNTNNPYYIWLSEVILQQTRVKQGLPYYEKFVENFPTIQDLAQADEQTVLRLWQGLGYYSRARNMHHTAQLIVNQLDSQFPDTYEKLLKLKGIGKYTAAAIASFAYQEAVAVLDGNVYRVLARVFGIDTDIASPQGEKEFRTLAQSLVPADNPADYNQAIMEFGAVQCTPQKPNCMFCPLLAHCEAYQSGRQNELPIKNLKIKTKERYFHYLIFKNSEGKLALKKRESKDIWAGLYDFHLLETAENFLETEDLLHHSDFPKIDITFALTKESAIHPHILTHQKIFAKFWHFELSEANVNSQFNFYDYSEIQDLPKPILIANYLEKNFF